MERYTYMDGGKWRLRAGDTEYSGPWVDLLAAYEDTGLEPKDVTDLMAAHGTAIGALAAYRAIGTVEELTRGAALREAQDEGRVVALPCKAGDEVRATVQRPYNGNTATIHGMVSDIQIVVRVNYDRGRFIDFLVSDFGKTVFFTHVEAEAALSSRKGETHESN